MNDNLESSNDQRMIIWKQQMINEWWSGNIIKWSMNDNPQSSNDQGLDHLIISHLEWMVIINKILTKQLWIFAVRISWTPGPAKLPIIGTCNCWNWCNWSLKTPKDLQSDQSHLKSMKEYSIWAKNNPICWSFNFFVTDVFDSVLFLLGLSQATELEHSN